MHIEDLLFSFNGKITAELNSNLASCTLGWYCRYMLVATLTELHISRLATRLQFSTSVNIIIFSIKRDYSFEYKTVLRHPGFRNRFRSVDFTMCGSSVRNRDASCLLRERSKYQKVHFTFQWLFHQQSSGFP